MSNNKNPFSDLFSAWAGNCPVYPSVENFNWDKAIAAGRANAKAFSDAAKAASEGAQALARRQAEIAQKSADEASKFLKDISSSVAKNPEASLAEQAKYAEAALKSATANAQELLEMAAKSNKEAGDIINKRISAVLAELAANTNTNSKKAKEAA